MLTDLVADGVEARAAELRADGLEAAAMGHDVAPQEKWAEVVAAAVDRFGGLDILVNSAGIAVLKWMGELSPTEWQKQIDVNLTGVFLGCDAAIRQMRSQGKGGAIVNLSSVAGLVGVKGTVAYSASKGGVRLFTKSVALEAAPENIRINSVHPGIIWTSMQKVAIADNKEVSDAINATIPMGRMGEPDDITAMVAFLASDDAKYITGGEFSVDGGFTAQ